MSPVDVLGEEASVEVCERSRDYFRPRNIRRLFDRAPRDVSGRRGPWDVSQTSRGCTQGGYFKNIPTEGNLAEPRIFKCGALAAFHALPLGGGAAHCKSSQVSYVSPHSSRSRTRLDGELPSKKDEDGSSGPGSI
ncbi:hypothetical protein CROQUDRAFT_97125 [Cronartium quercuum f. sp. fusiforme G11]|uniref:Uncharacterized protein n=1 Tax=Cronartium quercuum f. sp. fusiforme G11 TaxID=708437 RepID=A0A9P6T888_9BASI|nr:hypothetical protein CROQUDRAFT_97125 [Cronartium quercuum f. sp. fusiforme G11]